GAGARGMNEVGSPSGGAGRSGRDRPPRPPRAPEPAPIAVEPPRRARRGRGNRRITVSSPSVAVWVAQALQAGVRRGWVLLKALAAVAALAGVAWAGEQAMRHMVASPRFALREIRIVPTEHVTEDEIRALAGVTEGDKLLAVDTDAVAAR